MKVPFNMTTPKMKLADGEQVIQVQEGLRKKGIFGNRFGELYVTNQRVAFVKAIMKAGIVGAAIKSLGATPIVSFDRSALKAEKLEQPKKLPALVLSDDTKSERFVLEPQAIDQVIAALA